MKQITLTVPDNFNETFNQYTPEETALMLKYITELFKMVKNGFTETHDNSNAIISECELRIKTILELGNTERERYKTDFEKQKKTTEDALKIELEKQKDKCQKLEKEKIKIECELKQNTQQIENEIYLKFTKKETEFIREIQKYKEENNKLKIEHLHKQNEYEKSFLKTELTETRLISKKMMENIEKLTKQTNKSNHHGKEGESLFNILASETFETFDDFVITNQSKVAHSGDFHMHFGGFSILVDVKNYVSGRVNIEEIKKLKNDTKKNPQFKIAWLVSIESPISNYGKSSIQLEIDDGVLYCYINSLNKQENPIDILKNAWYSSKVIYDNILNNENDAVMLNKYKKKDLRIKKIAESMSKDIKQSYISMNQIKDNINNIEKNVKEILNDEIMSVREHQTEIVMDWWKLNILSCENGSLKTKALYDKFKTVNDNDKRVDVDSFKIILKSFLDEKNIVVKNEKTQYTILNVKWK